MAGKLTTGAGFVWLVLLGAWLLLGAPPAAASDGRVPVYEATTISSPGSYYLTQDVTGTVIIASGDVTLDLNGFTVSEDVELSGTSRVRLSNGRILGTIHGITVNDLAVDRVEAGEVSLAFAKAPGIEHVKCAGISFLTATGGRVADCTVRGGAGIALMGSDNNEILHNTVEAAGVGMISSKGNLVSRNTVSLSPTYGIFVSNCNNNRITENTVRGNTFSGLYMDSSHGNQIAENDIASNGSGEAPHGVWLVNSTLNELNGNMVHDHAAGFGFRLEANSWGNKLLHNTASDNGREAPGIAGFYVASDENVLDWNVAVGNSGAGIAVLGVRNILSHNRVLRNPMAGWIVNCSLNYCVHYYDGDSTHSMPSNIPGIP